MEEPQEILAEIEQMKPAAQLHLAAECLDSALTEESQTKRSLLRKLARTICERISAELGAIELLGKDGGT